MANNQIPRNSYAFKNLSVDYTYARQCRERCQPAECTLHLDCWVAHGTAATLELVRGTPRCRACDGKIIERNRFQ